MSEETFEEQFPSLKENGYTELIGAVYENPKKQPIMFENDKYYTSSIIQQHCLDKQRVKEAIITTWYVLFDNQNDYTKSELLKEFSNDLKKELGLDGE